MTSLALDTVRRMLLATAASAALLLRCGSASAFIIVRPPTTTTASVSVLLRNVSPPPLASSLRMLPPTAEIFFDDGTTTSAIFHSPLAPTIIADDSSITSTSSLVLSSLDFGAQVSDSVQTIALTFLVLTVIIAAASTYVTKIAVPEQMARLAALVEKENPQKWAEIRAKLNDGEKFSDRPDLMAELVESGMGVMVTENETKMEVLLESLLKHRQEGRDVEGLREPLETAFGMTIEEFVKGVDKATTSRGGEGEGEGGSSSKSKFVTETDVKMADLLRKEMVLAAEWEEEEDDTKE